MVATSPCVPALKDYVVFNSGAADRNATAGDRARQTCPLGEGGGPRCVESDRETLCTVMCCCLEHPSLGVRDRRLMQNCVANTLRAANDQMGGRSRYKPEVMYDMTHSPPRPKDEWYRAAGVEPEGGYSWFNRRRSADVVVTTQGDLPPTQENIARLYEMKFPGDRPGQGQYADLQEIAGDEDRFVELTPERCGCASQQRRQRVRNLLEGYEQQQAWDREQMLRDFLDGLGSGPWLPLPGGRGLRPRPFPGR